jgi:RsiW-degrading membrane proteinase PrsW (M82 family)
MADGVLDPSFLVVLIVSAFALPLVFLAWIRNTERLDREPWHAVLRAFSWGAVFSVILAIVFSLLLLSLFRELGPLQEILAARFEQPEAVFGVLVVAPLVEEAAKALGVRAGRRHTEVVVDGLVYGAAAGLGFSATENLFYGLAEFVESGAPPALVLIAFRSFSSSFLHASATAVVGYGIAKGWLTGRAGTAVPYYFVAVAMHATFNGLASVGELYAQDVGTPGYLIGFGAAAGFAVVAVTIVRLKLAVRRRAPG